MRPETVVDNIGPIIQAFALVISLIWLGAFVIGLLDFIGVL